MNDLIKDLELYEIDSLDVVYQLIVNDSDVMRLIGNVNQVWKYHIPEENRELPPLIKLSPISELPTEYADNKQLAWNCIIQVDVWDSSNPREIALKIHELMKSINFKQDTPTFEYDPETYLVRDTRRYRGTIISKLDNS